MSEIYTVKLLQRNNKSDNRPNTGWYYNKEDAEEMRGILVRNYPFLAPILVVINGLGEVQL